MPAKNYLPPIEIALNQPLSSSFTSIPTNFKTTDNVAYQINVTTTDSTGSIAIEGSIDYVKADPLNGPGVAGHWTPLTLSGFPSVNGTNDTILININECPYQSLRVSYTSVTAGTGTCNIFVMAKGLS